MATELKFLHASDLHLDRPLCGLAEIPAHLKESLANAPYQAATTLFDLALSEKVDFVLLSGDVVDLDQSGPRGAAFLLGQFERLRQKGIRVYWCAGQVDQPERWPAAVELPGNVVIFPSTMVEQATHVRNNKPLATICGAGYESRKRNPSDFRCEPGAPFPIALLHGDLDTSGMTAQNIRYWALGGRHQRTTIDKTGSLAVYPGTPQARGPDESGAHSCCLVAVDEADRIKVSEIEIDSIRWSRQQVTIAENASLEDIKTGLADRCSALRSGADDQLTLVNWKITTSGPFNPRLRNDNWHQQLVSWLRDEYGRSSHGIWTVQLTIDPPPSLPAEWYEEDTILGDFLRALGRYQGDSNMALSLLEYVPETRPDDDWLAEMSRVAPEHRENILRRAALTGVDYLSLQEHQEPA